MSTTPQPTSAPYILTPHIIVAVTNESTQYSDDRAQTCMEALQIQMTRDFAPIWGDSALMVWLPKDKPLPAGWRQLVFLDNSDQAGALGYHDLTPDLQPLAKVFVVADIQAGASPEVTASHENVEMGSDPDINLEVETTTPQGGRRTVALEIGDSPEADQYGYVIMVGSTAITVSDFVTPPWFNDQAPAGTKFDIGGHITAPFQLLPGGYANVNDGNGWTQIYADHAARTYRQIPQVGSRRERRRRGRANWLRSVARGA